jgi:hypothetical protein
MVLASENTKPVVNETISKPIVKHVQAVPEKSESYIYIGPTLSNLELSKNTIFKVIPNNVKKLIEECPEIGNLLIKTSELKTKQEKANKKGTKENKDYNKIIEYMRR